MGFTSLDGLPKYHFDSVDSTAWLSGNRFGFLYRFNGRTIEWVKISAGKKMSDTKKMALHNFTEWAKFQKYAEVHL